MSGRWSGAVRLTGWAWLAGVCACFTLGPLVDANRFLVAGAFAGALVGATGAAGRLAHLPAPVTVLAQVVVLLEWATLAYASDDAFAGVLPTPASLAAFADLAREAIDTSNANVPPAPATIGVTACLAVIVALVVLVVDLVAVTWRRPALVGLVFLAVYMAPVSLLAGNVPLLAFIPGALGYVFLLAAEQRDRLSHWGRQITHSGTLLAGADRSGPTVSSLISAGRRVGFGAVGLAVVVPLVVPTLPRTFLADGPLTADGGTRGGGTGVVEVDNPMLDLRRNLGEQSDEVLVRVTTDDEDPGYLRLAALDTFTGDSWLPSERSAEAGLPLDQVPLPPGLNPEVQRPSVDYDVEVTEQLDSPWLPTVYPVTSVVASGDWLIDPVQLDISASDDFGSVQGMGYSFTSRLVDPTRQQLEDAGAVPPTIEPFLALPDDLPETIAEVADEVAGDEATAIDQALALQAWFRESGEFDYSVETAEGDGMETIERFLTTDKVGYCEQFAASMALLARALNIPSRVAVGFLRPERTGSPGEWEYEGRDMHTWPELYFDGVGWLRFEPTPGTRTGPAPLYNQQGDPDGNGGGQDPDATSTPTPAEPERTAPDTQAAAAAADSEDGGIDGTLLAIGGGLLAALVLLVAPRLARGLVRRRRWTRTATGDIEPAWLELRDSAVDLGLAFDDRATLRRAGRALRSYLGPDRTAIDALNRLVLRVERVRFARDASTAGDDAHALRSDVETVVSGLTSGRSRAQLLRARWLPLSLLPTRSSWRATRTRRTATTPEVVVHVEGTATR